MVRRHFWLLRTEMWHIEQEFEFKITQSAAADKDKGEVYKLPQIESLHKGNLSNLKSDGRKMLTIYRKAHEPMRSNWGGKVSWGDGEQVCSAGAHGWWCEWRGEAWLALKSKHRHRQGTRRGRGGERGRWRWCCHDKKPWFIVGQLSLVWPNWLPKDWPWLATTSTVVLSKANWTGM